MCNDIEGMCRHIFYGKHNKTAFEIIGVRIFRGADCDTDNYLVVAIFRERLAVSKQ
jgi:hypothetical protein